jgi:hypothetical protein
MTQHRACMSCSQEVAAAGVVSLQVNGQQVTAEAAIHALQASAAGAPDPGPALDIQDPGSRTPPEQSGTAAHERGLAGRQASALRGGITGRIHQVGCPQQWDQHLGRGWAVIIRTWAVIIRTCAHSASTQSLRLAAWFVHRMLLGPHSAHNAASMCCWCVAAQVVGQARRALSAATGRFAEPELEADYQAAMHETRLNDHLACGYERSADRLHAATPVCSALLFVLADTAAQAAGRHQLHGTCDVCNQMAAEVLVVASSFW